MYCSMRFYLDNIGSLAEVRNTEAVLSMIMAEANLSYHWIEYSMLDPDVDFAYYYRDTKSWEAKEQLFLGVPDSLLISGKHGEFSAPFITAADAFPENAVFNVCRVQIQYPLYQMPAIFRVDYRIEEKNRKIVESYKNILQQLDRQKIHVNNSFVHAYARKAEACLLDGGQCGFLNPIRSRELTNRYIQHSSACFRNHIMDIFCANSIAAAFVCNETLDKLRIIIGPDCVSTIDDSIVFSLPGVSNQSKGYRLFYRSTIKKMRELFA